MKIPNIATTKTALTVAAVAFAAALFLRVFGEFAISLLCAIAFVALVYAAAKKWLPELFDAQTPKG